MFFIKKNFYQGPAEEQNSVLNYSSQQQQNLLDYIDVLPSKYQTLNKVKTKLHEQLQKEGDFEYEDEKNLNPCNKTSIANALRFIGNPVRCCKHVYSLIQVPYYIRGVVIKLTLLAVISLTISLFFYGASNAFL